MDIKEFIEMVKGCEEYCFTLKGVGETRGETIELAEVVEALEKQVAMNPKEVMAGNKPLGKVLGYICENCGRLLPIEEYPFCPNCGQRIDWEVE